MIVIRWWCKHLKKCLQNHKNAQNTHKNTCRDEDLRWDQENNKTVSQ